MAKKRTDIGYFKFNNDLSEIKFAGHNKVHFWGSLVMALFSSFTISYGIWMAWEILDGFKPWFTTFEQNPNQTNFVNWFRENALYADGFSLQDAVIWDLGGALIGAILNAILASFGINLSIL